MCLPSHILNIVRICSYNVIFNNLVGANPTTTLLRGDLLNQSVVAHENYFFIYTIDKLFLFGPQKKTNKNKMHTHTHTSSCMYRIG